MSNPQKAKGDNFERLVLAHVRGKGFPWAEKTRAGYERDHGDLHLDPITKHVIVQCKNHARLALPEWLSGLARQVRDAGARHGVLVVKRRGVVDAGRSYAVMELDDWLALVQAAGYGTPLKRGDKEAA